MNNKVNKVILIIIDTLRADHLSCYGYKLKTSPNIDKIADKGIIFNNAFSPCSYTIPSHTTMFTSKYPSEHCMGFSNREPVKPVDKDIFLAEVFSDLGYETAAFISGLILSKETKTAVYNGFKTYNDHMTASELNRLSELIRPAEETNKEVFKWLEENHDKDFFLFVHYFDVHGPYITPPEYENIFSKELYGNAHYLNKIVPENNAVGGIPEYQILKAIRNEKGELIDWEKDIRYYFSQYDSGIRYVDNQIDKLKIKLQELNIYEDSLMFITSDHGESLGENNIYFFHGLTVTPDQIHIPLIIKPHKDWCINAGSIDTQVSLLDLMPTLLDFLGYRYESLELQGKSLKKLIENGCDNELNRRTIKAEIEGQVALIDKDTIRIRPKKTITKDKLVFFYIEELCHREITLNYRRSVVSKSRKEETSDMLKMDGERFLPCMDDPIINYEHLHRYRFAKEFAKGKKVLDLACGEGYGSFMLAEEAQEVIGIDIDEVTIRYASSRYAYVKENLKFIKGSIADVPVEGEKIFDVIVCFEAIEHIEEHDKMMEGVKRLLKDDGIFLVSTPNKLYSNLSNYKNVFHLKELYFDEFKDFLSRNFKSVFLYGQKVYPSSNIFPFYKGSIVSRDFVIEKRDKEFHFLPIEKKIARYLIAIASDSNLEPNELIGGSYLVDISETLFRQDDEQIKQKDEQIKALLSSWSWRITAPLRWLYEKVMVWKSPK